MNKKKLFNKNILGFGLTSLFNDFSHEMTTAVLPALVEQIVGIKNTPKILGLISGISDAVSSILKVWAGILTDRITHYKLFLIIGYTITPLFVGLIGFTKNVWQVLIFKTIAWTGRGIREPMRDKWITEIESPSNYGKAFGFVRAFDTIGAILGPLTVYFALKFVSIKYVFFISFIPGILSVLSLIFLTHEEPIKRKIDEFTNWKNQIKKLPRKFNYFMLIMLIFGIGNFSKLLIIYRAQELLTGKTTSSIIATGWIVLLYTLFNLIRAISEYSLGIMSDNKSKSKKKLLALFGYGLFAISSFLMIISVKNIFYWIIIFILTGISTGTVSTIEKVFAATLLPENVRGTGFGLLQTIDGLGDLISSITVGALWSFISPEAGFIYALFLSISSMILLLKFEN